MLLAVNLTCTWNHFLSTETNVKLRPCFSSSSESCNFTEELDISHVVQEVIFLFRVQSYGHYLIKQLNRRVFF